MKRSFLTWLAAGIVATVAHTPTHAQQPGVATQPAGIYRFMIGTARVTALSDGSVPINLHDLLRGMTPAQIDEHLARAYVSNPLEASINAFLIESGSRRILVDTGAGEIFGPGLAGRIPQTLRAAGIDPDRIDDILITHVHTDHSGGLVVAGKRVYPRAIVHVGKPDVDYFLDKTNAAKTGYDARYFDEARVTLKPYLDAGKLQTFAARAEILPGIVAELRPGHTPGSAFYTLTSGGQSLVFVGDIIHAAAVQFPVPTVTITFDQDQAAARDTRLKAFAEFAANGTLIAAPHLSFPGVGHIRADTSGYRWLPIEYGDRGEAPANSTRQLEKLLRSGP